MSKISQKLARSPNEVHEFDHNGQIKEFLIDLNIESKFNTALVGERVQAVNHGEHPTHFILIALYSGYKDQKQNGYVAWCLPKKRWSFEQFTEFAKRVLNPTDERIIGAHLFWTKPGNPSN